ncbi:MAG TPA: sulfatase [Solirubrobacterales bacterium]|jgi:arylsulfatase A-like enzyme
MHSSRPSIPTRASQRLTLSLVALLALASWGLLASDRDPGGPEAAGAAIGERPNIVLIQTDDQTYRQFSRQVMPNTKRLLANHGTTFRDYIATTAQCCPSRASLLTGQYAHNDGVTSNGVGYRGLVDKGSVLPVWLQQAGYLTLHVGKFMNGYQQFADPPSLVPPGWDQWYSFLGGSRYYNYDLYVNGAVSHRGDRATANATRVANRKAVQLVRNWASEAVPIYLQLDEPSPHIASQRDPFGQCAHAPMPERRDEGAYRHAPLPKPPSFNERDMRDKPAFLRPAPRLARSEVNHVRKRWRCAIASLKGVDRGVAQVYRALKRAKLLRRTVFVFISDNGQFFGEHRIEKGKVLPYREALHLPLVIKAPKRYLGGQRAVRSVARPVANVDLAPTILSFAHAEPCPPSGSCRTLDGRSLVPLLTRSEHWPKDRGLLTEYNDPHPGGRYATCRFDGVVTGRSIYVQHPSVVDSASGQCVASDEVERYDLKRDPFELHNLCFAGKAANCPVNSSQSELESRLDRLRHCAGVRGRDHRVDGRPFCE